MKKKEKTIDTKIDELAQVVASGFADVHKEIKGVRSDLSKEIRGVDKKVSVLGKEIQGVRTELGKEIDDLARMVASGFTETQKETRDGLAELRDEFKADMKFLRGDIDIMLDRHIGTFRKDYDELAARVKKLEQLVLTH